MSFTNFRNTSTSSRNDQILQVLSSSQVKPGQFIAGADLREFAESIDIGAEKTAEMCSRGQALFRRLSTSCPFLTVAAIEGICVGGGAELAAWCDRRIMSDHEKTEFGFPEVKLGLFPGWGGTVRGPRIVGLSNAVEMITGGNSISAQEAFAMGWASDVVPSEDLLAGAINLIRVEQQTGDWKKDRERWDGPIDISEAELGFLGATASALIQQHSKGHYPAPMKALETMMGGSMTDAVSACQLEATGMANLFGSPINKSLLNIFFLTDRNKKDSGISGESQPAKIQTVGVIGRGNYGGWDRSRERQTRDHCNAYRYKRGSFGQRRAKRPGRNFLRQNEKGKKRRQGHRNGSN